MKINIKGLCLITILLMLILTTCVSAQGIECNIKRDIAADKITLSGTAPFDDQISIQILPSDVDLKSMDTSIENRLRVAYTGDFETDKSGDYSLDVILRKSGRYVIYLASKENKNVQAFPFYFSEYNDYLTSIQAINSQNTAEDFNNEINKNIKILGLETDLSFDSLKASNILYKETNGKLSETDYSGNANNYITAAAIIALNDGTVNNILPYISEFIKSDSTLYKYIVKHTSQSGAAAFFTKNLSGKNIKGFDDLIIEVKKAIILTAVKYPDGNMNIKDIFGEYEGILGITSVSSNASVYSKLAGNTYNTISDLVTVYNQAVNTNVSDGGAGGGTGGGATGKNITNSVPISKVEINGLNGKNNATDIGMKFTDLDAYDWAYTDISTLFEKGIINGYTENLFRPGKSVKREEFVKMLVCAMGLDKDTYNNAYFDDIPTDTWYYKYISIAYGEGLVNGIGNGLFGAGNEITRQDMAVIIYKSICTNGYKTTGCINSYDDKEQIDDYAMAAISELSELGIISGTGDNKFEPKGVATRAQSVVIISRALKYLQQGGI